MTMTENEEMGIAFCWYEPKDWELIKQHAADSDAQDDTYEEWKSNANSAVNEITRQGHKVAKYLMKADEFFAWCKENNFENNASARSEYAARKLKGRKRES
jgi:hypothetical protein